MSALTVTATTLTQLVVGFLPAAPLSFHHPRVWMVILVEILPSVKGCVAPSLQPVPEQDHSEQEAADGHHRHDKGFEGPEM